MSEFSPLPDPLEEFLRGDFEQPADERVRQAILEKTNRVLSRGRMLRRLSIAASLAACFMAGVAVGGWGFARSSALRVNVQAELPAGANSAKPEPPVRTAVLQEWEAFDAQENRAEFYLAAGRKYLRDDQDYASALRCYRQALDLASEESLAVSADDDWLLTTLKQARKKENTDADLD